MARESQAPALVRHAALLIAFASWAGCSGGGDVPIDEGGDGLDPGAGGDTIGALPDAAPPPPTDAPPPPHEVHVCAGAPYQTIREAVAAVAAYGTVYVCPGTYQDTGGWVEKPLRLVATGGPHVTFVTGLLGAWFNPTWAGSDGWVSIEGFTNRGAGYTCRHANLRLVDGAVLEVAKQSQDMFDNGGGLDAIDCGVDIDGVTFAGNRVSFAGGGARFVDSRGVVRRSVFADNRAGREGGGLAIHGGAIEVRDTIIRDNTSGQGAGAYVAGDAVLDGVEVAGNRSHYGAGLLLYRHAPRLADVTIRDNHGFGLVLDETAITFTRGLVAGNGGVLSGGGITASRSSGAIEDVVITGNRSTYVGGGLSSGGSTIAYRRLVVEGNEARFHGGGVHLAHDRSTFTDLVVEGNRARVGGGLLVRDAPAPLVATHVSVRGNHATDGAGIALADNPAPIDLRGWHLDDNVATGSGGAIYTVATDLAIRHARLAGNRAAAGGALWAGANPDWDPCDSLFECPPVPPARPVRVEHSTLHGNAAADGAAIWIEGPRLEVRGAILADNPGASQLAVRQAPPRTSAAQPFPLVTWTHNATLPATWSGLPDPTGTDGNLAVDCAFVDAAARDFHLAPGSPCIDAGSPGTDPDGSPADLGMFGG